MIPEIRNHSYQQRLKLIEVFKYLNRFKNVSPKGLFDYDFNDWTRNNGKKLIVRFNTSVAQHFPPSTLQQPGMPFPMVSTVEQ